MASVSIRERFRYRVDNFLAGGSGPLFISLVVSFTGAIAAIWILRLSLGWLAEDEDTPFRRQAWTTFLQLTDPGNMSQDNDTDPIYKVSAIVAGFTGVVIFSSLIAFLTTALNDAIAHLRKGHSRVVEEDHTLILGWTPRVVEILNELAIANESSPEAVVVILADVDKEQMDEHLRVHFTNRRTTRAVTRQGSTASLPNLTRVSADSAKSAIVLATCDAAGGDDDKLASDSHVVKTVLALGTLVGERSISIVAEVYEPKNRQLVQDVVPGRVVVVDAEEILAKIMVQTSRTTGLAVVYSELLSFDGCEIYFHHPKAAAGVTFGEAQFRFADGVPIGLKREGGELVVRPAPDTVLGPNDELVVVAQDDSSIAFQPKLVATPHEIWPPQRQIERKAERLLMLGWSTKSSTVIREYANYVLEGSAVDIVLRAPSGELRGLVEELSAELSKVTLQILELNPLDRDALATVKPFEYDTVLVFQQDPDADLPAERVDAESLMALLHLRRLARDIPPGVWVPTKIITEVLDSENQDLISRAGVDDFIISERLVSMVLAQLSEQPRMKLVYDDLFQEEGSEIYVKPAWLYFERLPVQVRFCDLMRVAQNRKSEVCIGYKLKSLERDATKNFGVSLVPPKDQVVNLTAHDALVVVAEDDR